MSISVGKAPFSEYSQKEIISWMNRVIKERGKRRLRTDTALMWYTILRSFDELKMDKPRQTVRGIFYQLASVYGIVSKSDRGYAAVQKQVLRMRREGVLPYDFVVDSSRWMRRPTVHNTMREALLNTQQAYRRNLWNSQNVYVEIWIEKDTLAGIVHPVTNEWQVPLLVSKGFSSDTYCYEAAQHLKMQRKLCFVYILSDFDSAGYNIAQKVQERINSHGVFPCVTRLGLTAEQIATFQLPTRQPKRDDLARGWEHDFCAELDALPADKLQNIVRRTIESHIDVQAWQRVQHVEQAERESLENIMSSLLEASPQ